MDVKNTVWEPQGPVVQVGKADNVHVGADIRKPPHELPSDVPGFAGRDAELAQLDELLAGHPNRGCPVVISGPAGAGKTALAVHWAHRKRADFPDGELFLDLRGNGAGIPIRPIDALAGFLRSLGDHQKANAPTLAERSAQYRTSLHERRMLVLLDNVRDAQQASELLPGDKASLVLLTSRDDLAGIGRDATRLTLATRPESAMPESPPATSPPQVDPTDHRYDVFVSYAADDAGWVDEFVGRLQERGVTVARDVLLPGDLRAHTVAQAIMDSQHGLLVFSRAALADGWISEEYEVLLQRSVTEGQRFIPVVIDDVPLPQFARTRYPCDFRRVSAFDYSRLIDKLLRALKPGG